MTIQEDVKKKLTVIPQDDGFEAEMNIQKFTQCDCCHDVKKTMNLRVPYTKYNDRGILKTTYMRYWMCEKCFGLLCKALKGIDFSKVGDECEVDQDFEDE